MQMNAVERMTFYTNVEKEPVVKGRSLLSCDVMLPFCVSVSLCVCCNIMNCLLC